MSLREAKQMPYERIMAKTREVFAEQSDPPDGVQCRSTHSGTVDEDPCIQEQLRIQFRRGSVDAEAS